MGIDQKVNKEALAISILIPLLVGLVSSLISGNSMEFYQTLKMPSFAPPGYVFPIVWTILYILMGISSYLIYMSGSEDAKDALIVYGIQLFFNFTWSILFFKYQAFGLSFLWILILWAVILFMILKFYKVNKVAAYLQIPYLLWVTFAGFLNFAIYRMN